GGQNDEGYGAADDKADAHADQRQCRDLGEEMDEDAGPAGAHGAHDGDDAGALGNIGAHAGPDAHSADEEGAQTDNDQEAHEEIIVAHHLAQPVAGGADGPTTVAELAGGGGKPGFDVAI